MINTCKSLLIVTYFYATKACCPAEWADDKVHVISKRSDRVILLTSLSSQKTKLANVKHYRIPSLSLIDLRHEISDLRAEGGKIPFVKLMVFLPFIVTIGLPLDLLQKLVISGNGGGKWSWTISASLFVLYVTLRYRYRLIFTTGGPSSAHLVGVVAAFLKRAKLVCELQDPLTGEGIGRSLRSAILLNWVEKIIMKSADKVVYVTKRAANLAQKKYLHYKAKIVSIYPGSRVFSLRKNDCLDNTKKLRMIHLGTLYSTRNLNSLIDAIDELIAEKRIDEEQIEILNLGEIYGEIKEHHLTKPYIKQVEIKSREEAIQIASSYMVSLLVQHADNRSETTIPYKTYDYINIGNPIFALTKNKELADFLSGNGYVVVGVSDVLEIKKALLELVNNYDTYKNRIMPMSIDIYEQTRKILRLSDVK